MSEQAQTSFSDGTPTNWATPERLGPLQDLPGYWEGVGFSLIARPNFSGGNPNKIFLQLNLLRETLEFSVIGSPVFNRGSQQGDITIYGLNYMHRVTDATTGGPLHNEPGQFLYIPATDAPKSDASIARQGSIPHGNAFCAVGFSEIAVFQGLPDIPPANTIPFKIGDAPPAAGSKNPYCEFDLSKPNPFRTDNLPPEITQALVNDPNQMLRDALQGQNLKKIVRLITTTPPNGGISNIPFIVTNADTVSLESVFAIETVQSPNGDYYLQLQYSQTALLNFNGFSFPHVTVGTLVKAF